MSHSKKVLITGASGMLGKALTKKLSPSYTIAGLSKSGGDGRWIACDLADKIKLSEVFHLTQPEWVINTAAYSDVDGCERDPRLAHEANALSVKNLSELCGQAQIPLIHVSTDYVFDGKKTSPYCESESVGPVNIYGMTKLTGEFYALTCTAFSASVRTSWLFGEGNPKNFVNVIADKLKHEPTVSVLDDQMDSPTSVQDLSIALQLIGEKFLDEKSRGLAPRHEIYHVCNDGGTTRYDMTVEMRDILKLSTIVQKTDRASVKGRLAIRPGYVVMSRERFEKEYGVRMRPWQKALAEYLAAI